MKLVDDDGQVIAEGQTIALEPGDVLVFQTKRHLCVEEHERIRDALESGFPGHRVAVIEEGDELNVLRSTAKGAATA